MSAEARNALRNTFTSAFYGDWSLERVLDSGVNVTWNTAVQWLPWNIKEVFFFFLYSEIIPYAVLLVLKLKIRPINLKYIGL